MDEKSIKRAIQGIDTIIRYYERKARPLRPFKTVLWTLGVAKSCMEKQVSKKLKADKDGWLHCSCCGETFSLANMMKKKNKYCGECGQMILWEEGDT
jgi:hypothetical protein